MPHLVVLCTIPLLILRGNNVLRPKLSIASVLILSIVLLTALNKLFHVSKAEGTLDIIPYTVFIPIAYFIAINLKKKDLQFLVYLIIAETLIGVVEYQLGVKSFFTGLAGFSDITNPELLYNRSVFGLSSNSSTLAEKLLLSILLLSFFKIEGKKKYILLLILIIGLIITFNRSSLLAAILFFILNMMLIYKQYLLSIVKGKVKMKVLFLTVASVIAVILVIVYTIDNIDFVIGQFTRNRGKIELSNRDVIWRMFGDFILQNPLLGNGSYKLYVEHLDRLNHAHNSYLQLIATNGILISIVYLTIYFRAVTRKNFIYVIPIFFFSMGQYAIFWGISLTDIILLLFLFNKPCVNEA